MELGHEPLNFSATGDSSLLAVRWRTVDLVHAAGDAATTGQRSLPSLDRSLLRRAGPKRAMKGQIAAPTALPPCPSCTQVGGEEPHRTDEGTSEGTRL